MLILGGVLLAPAGWLHYHVCMPGFCQAWLMFTNSGRLGGLRINVYKFVAGFEPVVNISESEGHLFTSLTERLKRPTSGAGALYTPIEVVYS